MRSLKTLGRFVIAGACIFAITVASADRAMARKQYMDGFKANYADLAKKEKISCAVCHPTKTKKERNNYGVALKKALGKDKKTKDKDIIKKAIEKASKEKSATEGKTFADLIKDGKLPGTKDVVKEDKDDE